jgi:hypothetical protein
MPAQSSACAEVRVESVPFMLHRGYRIRYRAGEATGGGSVPVARAGPEHIRDRLVMAWMGYWANRKKGAWWMPRRWRPRKDAATRRNAPGRRWQPGIRRFPNGATRPAHGRAPCGESREGGTGGSETSEYPEEQRGFPQ